MPPISRRSYVPASLWVLYSPKELRSGPSSDALMRARELLDEVPDLDHTAARLRNLLIEPKTPGEITTSRLSAQGLDFCCIILNVGFRSGETFADELLRLAPQGACDLIEPDFGVVLHAPEHPFALPDLCGLHVGERVRRKQHGAFPSAPHLSGHLDGKPRLELR